jgi:hypothetical protein
MFNFNRRLGTSVNVQTFLWCNIKENLGAETQRIKAELKALEGLISQDFKQIITFAIISKREKELQDLLTKELHLSESQ